ncbi:MAG: dTDP-glucose 4,6-dehydratase [Blastocatellia bacterium]|nr:dTDP-glucose 4,6-dehydratase [Blastocatellia bacterium]MCS7156554.1 dTDP-glucose 4,6-dehydratase [Blastocatellia bacterium]MDW8168806.1 dTDP-glucose 4,6-dehydratase [Acidobacteriota bacterium]MDW8257480.1 dTDP-glucose 4,6-dehydratase [Acidobacteriota bacterium]
MKLFVTGGAGFIGSNFIRYMLGTHRDCEIVNFDKLTYAGNLDNVRDVADSPRYRFVRGDICDPQAVLAALEEGTDAIVNFAAETHVDRSIEEAAPFVRTNVLGVQVLLDAARVRRVARFVQISTDEVMGSLGPTGYFTEESPLRPNSPYAASKAAAELLVRAAHRTFGMDVLIVRAGNNYGPYQFPEKLIPLMITNAMADLPLPIYGDGQHVRDWIYVEDYCRALDVILRQGRAGEIYCVGARSERTNLEVVELILELLGKPRSLIRFVEDRPGHDRRYAIDPSKVEREFGWRPQETFESGLRKTIAWYCANRAWVEKVRSGEYQQYYERMYGRRRVIG